MTYPHMSCQNHHYNLQLHKLALKDVFRLPYTVSLEEFVAVDNDNVCTTPIMMDKSILELVQSSKNIIDADSDDESEMNIAAP
ncbi:hypothetical protein TNCV_3949651 [Trichonephila clavipes]|nr:hypothetical protein TNCV_3949651 [Trichonephila clavipes]